MKLLRPRYRVMVEHLEPRLLLSGMHGHVGFHTFNVTRRSDFSKAHHHAPQVPAVMHALQNSPLNSVASAAPSAVAAALALSAPATTLASATSTEVDLSATAAAGGSGTYSYQWYRGTSAGFAPSAATVIANATTLVFADTSGLVPDVPYFYVLAASDGTSTVYSNQVIGALSIPTTPINLPYQSGPVVLAYIGSSTWQINQGSGEVPSLINGDLQSAFPATTITTINGAYGGKTTSDYMPGQPLNAAVKSAVMASSGYKVLRLMIGSNDAAVYGRPASTWLSNMQTIVNDARTWPVDQIVLEEIGLRLDGGNTTLDLIRQYNAARVNLLGPKVVLGTAFTYENQALHLSTLSSDHVHQTDAGQIDLASNQATELTGVFTAPPPRIVAPATDYIGKTISATLSEPGCLPVASSSGFSLTGTAATISSWSISGTTITFSLSGPVAPGENVALNAVAGTIQSPSGSPLAAFTGLPVANNTQATNFNLSGDGSAYYVTLDPTQTYVQISSGSIPLATPTYQIAVSALPALSFNFTGTNEAVYIDFANGSPIPAGNMTVTGVPLANDQLYVLGQNQGQVFNMTDYQIGPATGTGGAIAYQTIDGLHIANGTFDFSGNLSTVQRLSIENHASMSWA